MRASCCRTARCTTRAPPTKHRGPLLKLQHPPEADRHGIGRFSTAAGSFHAAGAADCDNAAAATAAVAALQQALSSGMLMPAYGDAKYWDERYTREPTCFDWYQGWTGLAPILTSHIATDAPVLHLGVGTSKLQADMVSAGGYASIVNTDISTVAVSHMAALHKALPQLSYRVGDVRSMPEFGDASFGGIVDKGTLDALLCGEKAGDNGRAMLAECHRVLSPGCCLVLVTYGEPSSRLPLLLAPGLSWQVALYVLTKDGEAEPGGASRPPLVQGPYDAAKLESVDAFTALSTVHFVYVCTKQPDAAAP